MLRGRKPSGLTVVADCGCDATLTEGMTAGPRPGTTPDVGSGVIATVCGCGVSPAAAVNVKPPVPMTAWFTTLTWVPGASVADGAASCVMVVVALKAPIPA